jgi:RNA polymerase sigma factor (sigma-70 family)
LEPEITPAHSATQHWSPLIERVATGDPAATQELYEALAPLRHYFSHRIGVADCEDAYHQVILKVIVAIRKRSLRQPERLLGYVYTLASRYLADRWASPWHHASDDDGSGDAVLSDPAPSPETQLARRERVAIARRILEGFPDRDREILIRFYLKEQRHEQIEQEMGITSSAFRQLKSRAKLRFTALCQSAIERKPPVPATSGFSRQPRREVRLHPPR